MVKNILYLINLVNFFYGTNEKKTQKEYKEIEVKEEIMSIEKILNVHCDFSEYTNKNLMPIEFEKENQSIFNKEFNGSLEKVKIRKPIKFTFDKTLIPLKDNLVIKPHLSEIKIETPLIDIENSKKIKGKIRKISDLFNM